MIKKILIIRLGAIGDVVHSTVIQQSIKQKYPDYEIHFLTSEFIAPLIENDPNLAKIYKLKSDKKDNFLYLLKLGWMLRKEKFDVVFNLQSSLRNAILILIASPKQLYFRNKMRIHAIDSFLNTAKDAFNDIERPQSINLYISDKILENIEIKVEKYPKPFIIISPGGENNNTRQGRIWPIEYWISLSKKILKTFGGTVFIVGSKSEREYHQEISRLDSTILFTGELSLEESAGLFSKADLFISGDSGPLHMASALNIKTLGVMGSTSAISCGPFGKKCYAISPYYECKGCEKKLCEKMEEGEIYAPCIKTITPDIVFNFIESHNLLN